MEIAGFRSSAIVPPMSSDKTRYEGQSIDVLWDRRLCIHASECGRADDQLFVKGREPWCAPDVGGSADEVAEVVERCPTGALTHHAKDSDGPTEIAEEQNTVVVANHGPLYLRGELSLEGAPDDMPGIQYRMALCRCGESSRKPFCDNSHEGKRFRDRGAVGRVGEDYEGEGGPLRITPTPNGPLRLDGKHWIVAASGRPAYRGTRTFLCRCGQSANKPFCDGSHKAAGFEAE